MKIEVTANDISKAADRVSPPYHNCPVAFAARRAYGHIVNVDGYYLSRTNSNGPWVRILPREARNWIKLWDSRQNVTPITFEVMD